MIYLNSATEGFEGGATVFLDSISKQPTHSIVPKEGTALIFLQDEMLHFGEKVTNGTKYIMRTDIMYLRDGIEEL